MLHRLCNLCVVQTQRVDLKQSRYLAKEAGEPLRRWSVLGEEDQIEKMEKCMQKYYQKASKIYTDEIEEDRVIIACQHQKGFYVDTMCEFCSEAKQTQHTPE